MKTSNKWLLAALLLLLGSLSAFNLNLRTEYKRGAYKDPLRNTNALNFKDFDEVDIQAASRMGVKLTAGPYAVRVNKEAAKYVKVSQQDRESLGGGSTLTISLPQLRKVVAGATYSEFGKTQTDKGEGRGGVRVQGFRQDSLLVQHDYATKVELADNKLAYLRAESGQRPGSRSVLHFEKTNFIQAADLNMQAQSELEMEGGHIARLGCQFGDSVKATLSGASLRSLERQ